MNNAKTYTAQEMREMAGFVYCPNNEQEEVVSAMLRQAADAEGENAKLRERLAAVEKECEKMRDDFSKRMRSFTGMFALNMRSIYEDKIEVVDAILRTARGEGGAE